MQFKYLKVKELQKLTISLLSGKHKIAVRNAGNYVTRTQRGIQSLALLSGQGKTTCKLKAPTNYFIAMPRKSTYRYSMYKMTN